MPQFSIENIFTYSEDSICNYITLSEYDEDFIIECQIDVLAMPDEVDDAKEIEILRNPDQAI